MRHCPIRAAGVPMLIERRLEELGITLPKVPTPVGSYLPAVQMGDLLFLCGQGPLLPSGVNAKGKLGGGVSVEEGYKLARLTGLYLGIRGHARRHQWLLGSLRRGLRRQGPPRPLLGRHVDAAGQYERRDRGCRAGRGRLARSRKRRQVPHPGPLPEGEGMAGIDDGRRLSGSSARTTCPSPHGRGLG